MSNNFHLQLYRGTTAQNNAYTGLAGEITADTQAGNIRLHDGSKAGGYVVASMPVGSIIPYAGTTIPDGYLLCDGSAISRTTYSALFTAIGTTYGEGDGNSTFNIPSVNDGKWLRFCSPDWYELGYTLQPGLPNITGTFMSGTQYGMNSLNTTGAFEKGIDTQYHLGGSTAANGNQVAFNASLSNSIYGNSNTVQPYSIFLTSIIKY